MIMKLNQASERAALLKAGFTGKQIEKLLLISNNVRVEAKNILVCKHGYAYYNYSFLFIVAYLIYFVVGIPIAWLP